ncbi:hypothetical protein DL769_001962 [Monosporascus sp. CRB-8-3]|nr:hypothetical protein DL769_001962 [Monosporascus sp. CRB-8-3]
MTDKRPPPYDSTWSNLTPDVKRRWRQNREAERNYNPETPSFHLPRTTEVEVSTAGNSPDVRDRHPGTKSDTGRGAQQRRGSPDNRESGTEPDDITDAISLTPHSMPNRADYASKRQQVGSDHRESPKSESRETRGCRFAGDTALHKAAAGGHETMTKLLLEGGADIELPNHMGQRALHLAADGGHFGVVRVLVGLGADVEAADPSGMRPLHLAAMRGHDDIARFLLRAGAHVNAQDSPQDK